MSYFKALLLLTFTFTALIRSANSDDIAAPEMNPDQTAAADVINERTVLSTVSFLSSDELAGRNTPSTELRIASAYVAARFRGAGLEPPDGDDTYFQTDVITTTQPPGQPVLLLSEKQGLVRSGGTLCGGPEDLNIVAEVLTEKKAMMSTSPEIVVIDELKVPPGSATSPTRVTAALARRVQSLADKGVQVVLMKCSEQSYLRDVARQLQISAQHHRDGLQPSCCVVLVEEPKMLVGTRLTVNANAQRITDAPVRNVVGILPGSDPKTSSDAIIVSAHLDHIGSLNRGDDRINNGADDNASGVTAVISMADAFTALKTRPKRTVIFTTFWGEEKGLLGSKAFVQKPPWPIDNIVANVNIEMVGRPEQNAREKAWMTGWKHSNLGSLMNAGSSRIGVEIFDRKDVGEMLYTRSDNHAFVKVGVIAHSFSAGSLHHDYHQPTDEWSKLDIPHMTKVIQGLFAGTLYIADSDVKVSGNP